MHRWAVPTAECRHRRQRARAGARRSETSLPQRDRNVRLRSGEVLGLHDPQTERRLKGSQAEGRGDSI